ncbi:hypothetical protein ACJMK2_027026, partial [Sinanodonta woodiana]
ICVDSANFSCSTPVVKDLVCTDPRTASNYCRKTCQYCDRDVVPFNADSCGDPIKEPVCKLYHDELCICDDIIGSIMCPRYCANHCGPVDRTVTCPGPQAVKTIIIGY